ncbi:aldo/keto reductase [Xylaria nigripes]|nr:aldo/keto reductase [Xylaria nigripes]
MDSTTASVEPDASASESKPSGYVPRLKMNDGHEIPLLAYGLGSARTKEEAGKITALTVMAIKKGYYHLDGAQVYKNEAELGAAIQKSGVDRSKLFVTTKLQTMRTDVAAAFAASLERLGLSYVDLYLIHAPYSASSPEQLQKTWAELEAIQASGRARSIGVSNFTVSNLETILKTARVTPAMNQIEYHPYLQHDPDGLLEFCRANNIAIAAYGPLTAITKASGGPCDAVYAELAAKYGVSEADVALRWCIDQGIAAITTSASEHRLQGYLDALSTFQLTSSEIERIGVEGKKKHFRAYWTDKIAADDRR